MVAIQVMRNGKADPVVAVVGAQLQQPVAGVYKTANVAHLDLQTQGATMSNANNNKSNQEQMQRQQQL